VLLLKSRGSHLHYDDIEASGPYSPDVPIAPVMHDVPPWAAAPDIGMPIRLAGSRLASVDHNFEQ